MADGAVGLVVDIAALLERSNARAMEAAAEEAAAAPSRKPRRKVA
jgi:hypothetical protein